MRSPRVHDAGQDPDLRLIALRRFSNADYANRSQRIVERFSTDFDATKVALLEAVGPQDRDARICELGFGTGWLLAYLLDELPGCDVWGLELSLPMTTYVKRTLRNDGPVAILAGDIGRLPMRSDAFDAVIVAWTLYFMQDVDLALGEIRRILKPGGKIVATTWANDHVRELGELSTCAFQHVFGEAGQREVVERFDVDSGRRMMRTHFTRVAVKELHGWLEPPDVETLVRFWELQHSPAFPEALAPVRDEFRRLAEGRLAQDGHLRITRHGGVFVGYKD